MSLLNAYNQILNENSQEVKGAVPKGKDLISGFKVQSPQGAINDVESPEEDKKNSVGSEHDGSAKELKATKSLKLKEAKNPFDLLYNKILAQENWEAEEEANEQPGFGGHDELSFSGDHSTGEGEIDFDQDGGDEEDFEEHEEDAHPMHKVLSALKSAVAALEEVIGSEEPEEDEELEEDEEMGEDEDEDENENEEPKEGEEMKEEVDAEILGHALVDLEKLAAGLTNPKSQVLKGAVPVAKGKATVPKGSKADGEPHEVKGKGESLEKKNNQDTGYVKNGKDWYSQ